MPSSINLLGMAQYRLGRYDEAARSLMQSDNSQKHTPADLAFLAMTHHQLGQKDLAQAALVRLQAIAGKPAWVKNEEAQSLLHEAEMLLKGPAEKAPK
jgi:hypothetical protein